MQQAKAWTVIDRVSIIWKSNLSDNIKNNSFQAVVIISTIWMHHIEIAQEGYESY